MAFCPACGNRIQEGTAFCPGCGKQVAPATNPTPPAQGSASPAGTSTYVPPAVTAAPYSGISDNLAGVLAYLFIPAILFLVIEPYNKNKFVRFHSFQSIFFAIGWVLFSIILNIFAAILRMIPVLSVALWLFLYPLISLVFLCIVVFLMFSAYQGKKFKLPIVGQIAEKQADLG